MGLGPEDILKAVSGNTPNLHIELRSRLYPHYLGASRFTMRNLGLKIKEKKIKENKLNEPISHLCRKDYKCLSSVLCS